MNQKSKKEVVQEAVKTTTVPAAPASLDSLLEVLSEDEMRHVVGGQRVKTPPFSA
jgi:hypothetical protein